MKTYAGTLCALLGLALSATGHTQQTPQTAKTFSQAVEQVLARPEFKHVSFGIEIYSLDRKQVLFAMNEQKLFTPGSTTKLLTEGTALHYFGPDYRFHTPVYRTGEIKDGTLNGDLVLVASGDPNLSNREQPDGTLAFADEDHSYGGPDSKLVPGNPTIVLQQLADQIKAAGIRTVRGHVLIDASLFPEGKRELGTGVVISPISVNDNIIDVTVTAAAAGSPATIVCTPQVPYIHFVNHITSAAAGSKLQEVDDDTVANPDGTLTVTLTGSLPSDKSPYIYGYAVPSPSRFAKTLFTSALKNAGITIEDKPGAKDAAAQKSFYQPQYRVAEHVSAPFSEEVKVTLKVSQNLHASMTPFLVGALAGKATDHIEAKGFALEHSFLEQAGLDLTGASQADGAGGAQSAFYSPDFMAHYLEYMSHQPYFPAFRKGLPILGRDGTLFNIQVNSPAAGQVFAKTGTFGTFDMLNKRLMLQGKGLAGYTTTVSGEPVAFALYLNHLELQDDSLTAATVAGQALGEISAAAHDLPIDTTTLNHP